MALHSVKAYVTEIWILWISSVTLWVTARQIWCHINILHTVVSVADATLDFETIRVFDESKLALKMKNQGKYDIAYKWVWAAGVWRADF